MIPHELGQTSWRMGSHRQRNDTEVLKKLHIQYSLVLKHSLEGDLKSKKGNETIHL